MTIFDITAETNDSHCRLKKTPALRPLGLLFIYTLAMPYFAAAFHVFDLAVILAGSLLSIVCSFLPDTHGTKWEKFKRWKCFYVRVIAQWLSRS